MTEGLRPYQQAGATWALSVITARGAALLADECGVGKTPQAIAAALANNARSVVIVCPSIVTSHWWTNLEKFGAIAIERHPKRRGAAFRGRIGAGTQSGSEWRVMSFEGFAQAVAAQHNGKAPPKTARWVPLPERCDFLILDEVHYLSSERSKRSKAVASALSTWPRRPAVLALSGTPMLARPRDLYNPLTLLFGRRTAGSFFNFTKRFCNGHWKEIEGLDRPVWSSDGTSNPEELAALLAPLMLRRTKAEVLAELPAVTHSIVEVELPETARRAAAEAARAAQEALCDNSEWGGEGGGFSTAATTSLARLLSGLEEHKLDAAVELAQELIAAGSRPLLFTTRKETARLLGERLCCPWVTGDIAAEKRRDVLLSGDGAGVATLFSLTTGIDLIAYDSAIFVGLTWLPSDVLQALGRLHRFGQRSAVTAHHLVCLGTLDEHVRDRVLLRLDAFAAIVGGEQEAALAGVLRGGSEEELMAAFIAAAREA